MNTDAANASVREEQGGAVPVVDVLSSLFDEYEPTFERYQWPAESLRWDAFVASVLKTLVPGPAGDRALRALNGLGLTAMEKLADIALRPSGDPPARAKLIHDILIEAGLDESTSDVVLDSLVAAAEATRTKTAGKVQRLIREESHALIRRVTASLALGELDRHAATLISTRWLQDILNLPVLLETDSTRAFCQEMSITPEQLVAAADELDINLALLDELLQHWHENRLAADRLKAELESVQREEDETV